MAASLAPGPFPQSLFGDCASRTMTPGFSGTLTNTATSTSYPVSPDGTCGPTSAGYYRCQAGLCCSQYGYCGVSSYRMGPVDSASCVGTASPRSAGDKRALRVRVPGAHGITRRLLGSQRSNHFCYWSGAEPLWYLQLADGFAQLGFAHVVCVIVSVCGHLTCFLFDLAYGV